MHQKPQATAQLRDAAGVLDPGATSFALRFDRPEIGQPALELRLCDRIATLVTAPSYSRGFNLVLIR
eukprot:1224526-Prymnesium_polylepis.4